MGDFLQKDDFYLYLISDSSMDYYPKNTMAEFTTLLPEEIVLDEAFKVALKSIIYPNILEEEYANIEKIYLHRYALDRDKRNHYSNFDYGNFPKERNESSSSSNGNKTLSRTIHSLRYDLQGVRKEKEKDTTATTIKKVSYDHILAHYNMFIYMDIVKPTIVGDGYNNILSVLPFDDQKMHYDINYPIYHEIAVRRFQRISIKIANNLGMFKSIFDLLLNNLNVVN